MKQFQIRLTQVGEITVIPDSQKLFGYLTSSLSKYFEEGEVSDWVKDVLDKKESCMISNLLPYPYLPTPKDYILRLIQESGIWEKNKESIDKREGEIEKCREDIAKKEKKYNELKKEINGLERDLDIFEGLKKGAKKNEGKIELQNLMNLKKKKLKKCKIEMKSVEEEFIKGIEDINTKEEEKNSYSQKKIYETIKKMDFLIKADLIELIQDIKEKKEKNCSYIEFYNYDYVKKEQTFVQKFKLLSQENQLPGFPNIAYSLPIIQFTKNNKKENDNKKEQKDDSKRVREFHFFVRTEDDSILAEFLEEKKDDKGEILLIGPKASQGYNQYTLEEIVAEGLDEKQSENGDNLKYLNLGMLLPVESNIDWEGSSISIYTSERRPFDISKDMNKEKVISFIDVGSILSSKNQVSSYKSLGKSIENPYNLMYKNAIVFGNSYLEQLEV